MVNVEIPVSSAVINIINVVILQFVLVPIVTGMTSTLAGFENSKRQKEKGSIGLESFDAPVIGGNLVTYKGFHRRLMIAIRISVVLGVGVSNVGLGGRSRLRKVVIEGDVYVPGVVPRSVTDSVQLKERVGRNVVCNEMSEDGTANMRSVINGKCYRDVSDYVFIKQMFSKTEEFNMSRGACEASSTTTRTIYKCAHADLVCSQKKDTESCVGVRYSREGTSAWVCGSAEVIEDTRTRLQQCRKLTVKREHLRWWTDAFTRFEMPVTFAVFASAYGVMRQGSIEVEDGEEEVTIVTLFWIVSVAWIVFLLVVAGGFIAWKKSANTRAIAHNERSLFRMLEQELVVTEGNECLVVYDQHRRHSSFSSAPNHNSNVE